MAEASLPLDEAGQSIAGRYLVEEVLGRGGMATVYRVLDTATGTRCALKRARAGGPGSAERRKQLLEREYYTLAQLAHPRIIAVYDFGRDERGPYYTMELLDGADLASLGRVPWPQACALLRDVASSLSVLHSRGLLHRDVSARNVRYSSASGAAKLLDFGALCSIGLDLEVVGTPPFVAPEAMQMQALDARTDLYALGALGYYLLSGRHAYPARQLRELRDVWRSAPPPIARLVPDLPPALAQLIMELLALDRSARPHSAAEIMKRVCTIAQLPIDEDSGASRAYLTAPALVGRDHALITARKQLLSLARGDGQTLLIEGAAGSGRSRMLDAAVLEGKMLGAIVLRGHAADGGDWAVARSLIEQLMPWSAEKVDAALRLSRDVLAHVVDGLGDPSATVPDRSLLIRELRDLVLTLGHGQRLLIAVDDADRIDEPSLALLAALAHKTERHPLVLALSTQRYEELPSSASLRLLASLAERIELTPLSPAQSEQLLRSVFGDVPNLPFVAAHIQRLAQGNPRAIMELAEHLVERGLCRYEGGSWSLPRALSERDLPSSLADALESRLRLLHEDARALCEAASIAELPALSAAQFAELHPGWPVERVFAALHELVRARVLSAEVEHYRFTQLGYASVAQAIMSDARKKALHDRMAELLRAREAADPVLLAHHLLEAERAEEAIAVLATIDANVRRPPHTLWQGALAYAERSDLPRRTIEDLRINLLTAYAYVLDADGFARVAPGVVARLCADSGLTLYQELAELPADQRLKEALMRTHQRFLDTPERERAYDVQEAIRKLARISMSFSMVALWTGDPEFLRSFPDLSPLSTLSPAIGVMRDLWVGASQWQVGRFTRAHNAFEAVLARVEQPDRAGMDPEQRDLIATVCVVLLGTLEGPVGIARCEQRALRLENDRSFRISAWRIRQLFHLSRGDMEQAKKCMRRAELLRLQEGIEQVSTGGTQGASMIASVRSEDLVGIEHTIVEVAALAQRMPYWQTTLRWGQSARLRLRGDPQAALETLLPALELARPGVHWMFGMVAAAHVQLLNELGRLDEAIERGYAYVKVAQEHELTSVYEVRGPLGLALARSGRAEEGLALVQGWLAHFEALNFSGTVVGTAYETAARICLLRGDREGYEQYAQRCAAAWQAGNNRLLNAKLARLLAEGDPQALAAAEVVSEAASSVDEGEYETVHSRINECIDSRDRARCALTLLLQQAERFTGYLYGASEDGQLTLLAALPDEPSPELLAWTAAWYRAELTASGVSQQTSEASSDERVSGSDAVSVPFRFRDRDGRVFEALLLAAPRDRALLAAGVLVLQREGPKQRTDKRLMRQIAALMLAHGDCSGVLMDDHSLLETSSQ